MTSEVNTYCCDVFFISDVTDLEEEFVSGDALHWFDQLSLQRQLQLKFLLCILKASTKRNSHN